MGYRLPPLNWLKAFDAAARHMNFAAAARELNMTQPAVSYHIRCLEEKLGATLFERHARRVELTPVGRAYLPAVRQAFSRLSAATTGLFALTGERQVSMHCPATLASLWLAPRLPGFRRLHPGIDIRLYTSTWAQTVELPDIDIDIRLGYAGDQGEDATLLRRERLVAVCSPQRAAALGSPVSLQACAGEDLIFIMGSDTEWSSWFERAGFPGVDTSYAIRVDNSVAALELAASGYGLALVFETFAQPYLATGRLVRPVSHCFESDAAHYIVPPARDGTATSEAIVFYDWLMHEV